MGATSGREAKRWLRFVKDMGPAGVDALEFTLLELANYDLHRQRHDIAAFVEKERSPQKTSKLYRAIAKTYLSTGQMPPASVMKRSQNWSEIQKNLQWVDDYEREDGTPVRGYWRNLRPGEVQSARTLEIIEGARQAALADDMDRRGLAEDIDRFQTEARHEVWETDLDWRSPTLSPVSDALAGLDFTGIEIADRDAFKELTRDGKQKIHDVATSDDTKEVVSRYMKQQSAAEGVRAVADFFAGKEGRFQFAWNAISKFGPFTGSRVAFNYFRYGGYDLPMQQQDGVVYTDLGDKVPAPESQETTRGWAIARLRSRLPGEAADQAKAEPPSEGFIIDNRGNLVAHAVGRGNDAFLPFSMRHLRAMRNQQGVEYVRRRMFGGPTEEDFHIAMQMGVDRFTIVSNSGDYTIELRDRSHGIKIEHFQIVERYQDLLNNRRERNNLDRRGYIEALSALQAEFPLHMRILSIDRGQGNWETKHDRITPARRLMDSLRALFGVSEREFDRQREEATRGRDIRDMSDQRKFDWAKQYLRGLSKADKLNPQAYVTRRLRQDPQNKGLRESLLREIEQFYRAQGENAYEKSWVRGTFNLDATKQPDDLSQPARARTPPPELGQVTTYKDPARAAPSQKTSWDWSDFPVAESRARQLGFNPQGTAQTADVRRLTDALQSMSNEEFQRVFTDDTHPIYDGLMGSFKWAG